VTGSTLIHCEEKQSNGVRGCARAREGEGNQRVSSGVLYRTGISDVLRRCLRLRRRNSPTWRRFLSREKREKGEGNSGFKRERSLGPLLHGREREK
jgi:hypothetical protein